MLHEALEETYALVSTVHGGLSKKHRDDEVMLFNTTCNHILVTTDALAEGVDQSGVNVVVNYDLPIVDDSSEEKEPDTRIYLQRFCSTDKMVMEKIERRLHHVVTEVPSWTNYKDVRLAYEEAGLGVVARC